MAPFGFFQSDNATRTSSSRFGGSPNVFEMRKIPLSLLHWLLPFNDKHGHFGSVFLSPRREVSQSHPLNGILTEGLPHTRVYYVRATHVGVSKQRNMHYKTI